MELNLNVQVPSIPKDIEKTKTDVRYMLIPPFVSVHIHWDEELGEVVYEIEEPVLNDDEKLFFAKLKNAMSEMINVGLVADKTQPGLVDYIDKTARILVSELGMKVSEESYNKVFYYLYRDFMGLNEIEPFMKDYFIEDIECNGVDEPIYIIHRIFRNMRTNIKFNSVEKMASFVEKMAQKTGRYISYASPLLDGTLPDGSRVNATYTKDVTSKGPTFTIRKFTKIPWTPTQLIAFNTLSPEMMAYLWILMQYGCNLLIVGGTASGKTTLLNAIAFFIPPEKRVVSIEDTRELNLPRENWLPAVSRTGVSATGVGEVDLFSLLKASFRQAPDYVIVGEVRGAEASVLFQGMASGHSSISTMHADSVETIIQRLETPPISLNPSLINGMDAVAVMSHALVNGKETRKLKEITEVLNVQSDGVALTNTPFVWNPSQDKFYFKKDIRVFDKIERNKGVTKESLLKELDLRARLLYGLFQKKNFDFYELQRIINDYYKKPEEVLRKYNVI